MLTKEDLRNIEKLFAPRFDLIDERFERMDKRIKGLEISIVESNKRFDRRLNSLRDNILQLNIKMDEGFERIYRFLFSRFESVEDRGHMNSVDIDMIKHSMISNKYRSKDNKKQKGTNLPDLN